MKIECIFPVLNEERRIEKGITETLSFLKEKKIENWELLIVDNGSTDKTEEIAKKICLENENVKYLSILEKGVGAAVREGVKNSSSDIVGYMDIDLSTQLSAILEMMRLFESDKNLGIVNASRYSKQSKLIGRSKMRNMVSYILVFILKHVLHMKSSDAICGFKFFKRDVLEKLLYESSNEPGWFLMIEVLLRAEKHNVKIVELPVTWIYEKHTKVKIIKVTMNYIKHIYQLKKSNF